MATIDISVVDNYICTAKGFLKKGEYKEAITALNNLSQYLHDTNDFEELEEKVNHPSHYQAYQKDGIECIDAMVAAFGEEAVATFCKLNAFKYTWRASSKNGNEDIQKAIWYLNKYLELGGESL